MNKKNSNKRNYWMKLKNDFFNDPKIKKLRRLAGGDTYTVISLKIMLLTINSDGILEFEGLEDTLSGELSLICDEDEKNIQATLIFMESMKQIIPLDNGRFDIPLVRELIGSETDSAARMRKKRVEDNKKKEIPPPSQCDTNVTSCDENVTTDTDTDLDLDLDPDTHTDIDIVLEDDSQLLEIWLNEYCDYGRKPSALKAAMRKKIKNHDLEAIEAFQEWKRERLENQQKTAEAKLIDEFDYSLLKGMEISGKKIINVKTENKLSTIHIYFEDGSEHPTYNKADIYSWYQAKNKEIA